MNLLLALTLLRYTAKCINEREASTVSKQYKYFEYHLRQTFWAVPLTSSLSQVLLSQLAVQSTMLLECSYTVLYTIADCGTVSSKNSVMNYELSAKSYNTQLTIGHSNICLVFVNLWPSVLRTRKCCDSMSWLPWIHYNLEVLIGCHVTRRKCYQNSRAPTSFIGFSLHAQMAL